MTRNVHLSGCPCLKFNRRDIVSSIFGAGLLIGGFGPTVARADPLKLRGSVKVDGAAASDGQVVKTGSTIEVDPGSEAAFAIGDDAFILRPASAEAGGGAKVVVEGAGTTVATMRLIEGGLLSVFGKGENRQVIGSTATIGIRGTGFYMESLKRKTYVCYCYGSFEFYANGARHVREEAHSNHHDGARFMVQGPKGPKIVPVKLGFGHSDKDLIAAERSVGRKPPFET